MKKIFLLIILIAVLLMGCSNKEDNFYNGIYKYEKEIEVENVEEPANLWITVYYENDKLISINGMGITLPDNKSRLDEVEDKSVYIPELNFLGILNGEKINDDTINYKIEGEIYRDSTEATNSEFTDLVNVTSKSEYRLEGGEYIGDINLEETIEKSDFKFDRSK